tara:strand:+ start:1532 stop:2620 length:1089 start_codon:yes stop_codon:yes gene_type:complete
MKQQKAKVLIIRCGRLGDTVGTTSIVKPIEEYYKNNVSIDWVTKPQIKDLFKYDVAINPLFIRYTSLPLLFSIGKMKIIFKSFFSPYDAVINLEESNPFDSFVRLVQSKFKVGRPYTPTFLADEHTIDHQLRVLKTNFNGINFKNAFPYVVGSNINVQEKFGLNKEFIVLCPTVYHFKKKNYRTHKAWPLGHWRQLIDLVLSKTNLHIVISGEGSSNTFIEQLGPFNDRVINLSGKTSLPDFVEILKKSSCTITNCSGSLHVASACCKKVIALHGPTNHKVTGGYPSKTNNVIVVSENLPCSPCFTTSRHKQCPQNVCMQNISPLTVFQHIIACPEKPSLSKQAPQTITDAKDHIETNTLVA